MAGRIVLLGFAAVAFLASSSIASAQVVDDFLCSTFSYKCNQAKPLPPPSLAPAEAPKAPTKHAARAHKDKRTPAKASAPTSTAQAPQ